MTSAPAGAAKPLGDAIHKLTEVQPCKRLQIVAILMGVIAVLGFAVAVGIILLPTGEGLGDLLDTPKADLMGQVKDAEGTPIPDATVTHETTGKTSTTGVSGWYFLEKLPTGSVEIQMEVQGFKSVTKTVWLERGEAVMDIVTEPGTGELDEKGDAVPAAGDPGTDKVLMIVGIAISSAFVLLGAISAWQHVRYPLVIVGTLLGVLTWGWYAGMVLSVLALLLVLPLRREFRDHPDYCEPPWHEPPPPSLGSEEDSVTTDETTETEANGTDPHDQAVIAPRDLGGMPPGI